MKSNEPEVVHLPESDLGDRRYVTVEYTMHGDTRIHTWSGIPVFNPLARLFDDGSDLRSFGVSHGSDGMLAASCIGYLRRQRRQEDDIHAVIRTAASELIEEATDSQALLERPRDTLEHGIATGTVDLSRYDLDDSVLSCLVAPMLTEPGVFDRVGGTGIYTRKNPGGDDRLVYVAHVPTNDEKETAIGDVAEFCAADVPVLLELFCTRSLGEYRNRLRNFIVKQLERGGLS